MTIVSYETRHYDRTPQLAYLNLSYALGMVLGGLGAAPIAAFAGPRSTLLVAAALQLVGCFIAYSLGKLYFNVTSLDLCDDTAPDAFNELFDDTFLSPRRSKCIHKKGN